MIVVVLSTVIGAMCALAIARGNLPGARLLTTLFLSPLMLPAILTGLALFQVFMLAGIGRPVWGLVAGHTLVAVPYVLRTTLAVLQNFDRRVEEAAAMLGAPPARVFFEVTLPLIRPGVIAGGIFAFIVSFDQLPISLFLVVPGGETLPVVLLNYIRFDLDGAIAAASMVSIVLALSARAAARADHRPARLCEALESRGETDMTKWKSRAARFCKRTGGVPLRPRSARPRSCMRRPRR